MEIRLSSADCRCGIFDSSYTFPGVSVTSPRSVSCYEIELYYESGGETYLDGVPYRIKRGAVFCVKPGAVRHSRLPLKCYYVKINAEGDLAKELDSMSGYFVTCGIDRGIELFFKLLELCDGEDTLLRHARLLELLHWIKCERARSMRLGESGSRVAEAVERGIEYIEKHYKERCTLEEIAAHALLSPVYFHKTFAASVGKTPYELLTELRLAEAKKLILMGGASMAEIAERCGFSSQSYFNAVFKQKTGETPGDYRRRSQEGYFKSNGLGPSSPQPVLPDGQKASLPHIGV